ncbi:MAG: SCO family protein [Acidimicrobiales bacterium]
MVFCAVLVCVAAAIASFAVIRHDRGASQQTSSTLIRPTGIPSNVSTRLAAAMGLSPVPDKMAPNFTLTDQHGSTLSLSSFRGHPVVLTFFDPHCVTMCPIVAQEFVEAVHDLARTHLGVVFVAVNVNRHALSVATVAAFTNEHQLDTVPTWHFFTGSLTTLHHIWSEYGVEVETRIVHGKWTVVHSSTVYFISPTGRERFLVSPGADYRMTATHRAYLPSATLAAWGRGISLVVKTVAH